MLKLFVRELQYLEEFVTLHPWQPSCHIIRRPANQLCSFLTVYLIISNVVFISFLLFVMSLSKATTVVGGSEELAQKCFLRVIYTRLSYNLGCIDLSWSEGSFPRTCTLIICHSKRPYCQVRQGDDRAYAHIVTKKAFKNWVPVYVNSNYCCHGSDPVTSLGNTMKAMSLYQLAVICVKPSGELLQNRFLGWKSWATCFRPDAAIRPTLPSKVMARIFGARNVRFPRVLLVIVDRILRACGSTARR